MTTIDKLQIIQSKRQHSKANIKLLFNKIKTPEPITTIGHMCWRAIFQLKWNHSMQSVVIVFFKIQPNKIHINKKILCQNDCILWRIIKKGNGKVFQPKTSCMNWFNDERWGVYNVEKCALIDLIQCQKLFSLIKSILDFQFDYLCAI